MNLRKLIKRELIITIISVLLITTIFFGVTYAIYMTVGGSELGTVELGDLSFEMCTDSSCAGVIENVGIPYINLEIYPMNDSEGLALSPYSFIAKNTGTVNLEVYIYMNLKNPFDINLNYNNMKIAFKESTESDYTVIEYGEEEYAVLKNLILESGQSKIINVLLWAEEDISNEAIGQSVYGFVNTVAYYYPEDSSGLHSIVAGATPTSIPELIKEYTYTGNYQEFTAEYTGWHQIELWGAGGGGSTSLRGKGGYTSGEIFLTGGDNMYIYVGNSGYSPSNNISFNGGGVPDYTYSSLYGGGGATDVRLVSGTWSNSESLASRIMVAAGGGSGEDGYRLGMGGSGGNLIGGSSFNNLNETVSGATQISGNAFGIGQSVNSGEYDRGAGGGGYYGGYKGLNSDSGGSGGSSFISGYSGVNAITSASSTTPTNNTKHYSGKYFINGEMQVGVNSGNGKAIITYVGANNPARINTKLNNVRYIKDCVNGSTANTANHWVELQAIYNGINVAYEKTVTGTVSEFSGNPYSRITDGDITSANYSEASVSDSLQCITVDLTQSYNLDEIGVWHYWSDGRTYYSNTTYVSSNNSTWTAVIANTDAETSQGKRVSAYVQVIQ